MVFQFRCYIVLYEHMYNFYLSVLISDGSVYLEGQLDFETTAEYNIIISAVDQGLPTRMANTHVLVRVTDVYDDRPRFNSSIYERELNVTVPVNTNVIELDAEVPANYTIIGIRTVYRFNTFIVSR